MATSSKKNSEPRSARHSTSQAGESLDSADSASALFDRDSLPFDGFSSTTSSMRSTRGQLSTPADVLYALKEASEGAKRAERHESMTEDRQEVMGRSRELNNNGCLAEVCM